MTAKYVEDERSVYCVSNTDTYLYRLDTQRQIMEQIIPLEEEIYIKNAYGSILDYKNYLVFVPQNAERIVLVERKSFEKEYIDLPQISRHVGKTLFHFFSGIIFRDKLFLFGYAYPGIVKVDLLSKKVEVIDMWLKHKEVSFNDENDGCFHVQYCQVADKVYFPFMNANAVLQFDLETEEVVIHKVGDEKQRYISIEQGENCFWLVPRDGSLGSIIKWDPISGAEEYFRDFPADFDYHKFAFYRTEVVGDELLLFAHCGKNNIRIDMKTGKMETFAHLYDVESVRGCKYPMVWKMDNNILALTNEALIIWDYLRNIINKCKYSLDEKIVQRYKDKEVKETYEKGSQKVYLEDNKSSKLETFLRYILLSS